MSYDLHLFRVTAGKDPVEEVKAVFDEDIEEINPGLPDPHKDAVKTELAKKLQLINPALEVSPFDYAELAKLLKTTVQEAQRQYRHLELNEADGGDGIQITLFDDTASLTIAYWHKGEKARAVWREAWKYLECLEAEGEFSTYDPQLGKILNLRSDLDEVVKIYVWGTDATEQAVLETMESKKPWWKFW